MDTKYLLVISSTFLVLLPGCLSIDCYSSNKVADGRTLGLLFGQWSSSNSDSGCDSVASAGQLETASSSNVDYDPVYSGEINDYPDNNQPKPDRPFDNSNGFSGLLNWLPNGLITEDHWPTRPSRPNRPHKPHKPQWPNRPPFRPPNKPLFKPTYRPPYKPQKPSGFNPPGWFWGWFGQGPNRPQKPNRPWGNKPGGGNEDIKPVYENIDDEPENVSWRPGAVVGGPSNDIIAVTQDLSSWNRPPTPRPTRPSIPGYDNANNNPRGNPGLVGSFVDLLFKK